MDKFILFSGGIVMMLMGVFLAYLGKEGAYWHYVAGGTMLMWIGLAVK